MMHTHRTWSLTTIEDPDELVNKLKRHTWCLCTGWRYKNTLWLNDSTSEDALQEYAVVRLPGRDQIESITVSWCEPDKLRAFIEEFAAEDPAITEIWGIVPADQLEVDHEPCGLCE